MLHTFSSINHMHILFPLDAHTHMHTHTPTQSLCPLSPSCACVRPPLPPARSRTRQAAAWIRRPRRRAAGAARARGGRAAAPRRLQQLVGSGCWGWGWGRCAQSREQPLGRVDASQPRFVRLQFPPLDSRAATSARPRALGVLRHVMLLHSRLWRGKRRVRRLVEGVREVQQKHPNDDLRGAGTRGTWVSESRIGVPRRTPTVSTPAARAHQRAHVDARVDWEEGVIEQVPEADPEAVREHEG